ncbi:MAG: hypothetical protein IBJ18_07060 [Phycisphaerales bacterium]|nr:hypothetical protein [Phycisphaerales bacterium]
MSPDQPTTTDAELRDPTAPMSTFRKLGSWYLLTVVASVVVALLCSRIGFEDAPSPLAPMLVAAERMIRVALVGTVELLCIWGFGCMVMLLPAVRTWRDRRFLAMPVGLGLFAWLCHNLGVLGLFSGVGFGSGSQIIAAALACVGVGFAVREVLQISRERASGHFAASSSTPWSILLAAPALGVMLLACLSVPGRLWPSEVGGYDVTSYHAPLVLEWARPGARLWPVDHNVYSFLPSYVEAIFLHIHAALGGGDGSTSGLKGWDGVGLSASQFVHAGCSVFTALLVLRLVQRLALALLPDSAVKQTFGRLASGVAAAAVVALPWSVVCGSMMYNEMAVCAVFAGALLVLVDAQTRAVAAGAGKVQPIARGFVVGGLMGAACGFKPTAMFLCVPTAAAALVFWSWFRIERTAGTGARARSVVITCFAGALGGIIFFAPPMIRNAIATSGNPVFPAATGLLGTAHWSSEQAARFISGHLSVGFVEGVKLLFSATPAAEGLGQPRGIFHVQWALLFPAAFFALVLSAVHAIFTRKHDARRSSLQLAILAVAVVGVVGALIWWAGFSHAQSRFLLPLAPVLAILMGLGVLSMARLGLWTGVLAGALGLGVVAFSSARCIAIFGAVQEPNQLLIMGQAAITGELVKERLSEVGASSEEGRAIMRNVNMEALVNIQKPKGPATDGVYLIGKATTLYFDEPVAYHTTWDARALGDAMEKFPDSPEAWSKAIRDEGQRQINKQIVYVIVDFLELNRLRASGWYDPRVTDEKLQRWMNEQTTPVREYRELGMVLLKLRPAR